MKLLTNRSGSYLTGDALADAVMHDGLALARKREMDVVNSASGLVVMRHAAAAAASSDLG